MMMNYSLSCHHSGFKKALENLGGIRRTIKERNWKKKGNQS